ncbi:hypothetical protein N7490_011039 [Penicillium lividum]|nr:hypothetical protein N7490_011039 [Penicillium lividum]
MSFATPATLIPSRTWTREGSEFFISNDPAYISVEAVNRAFGMDFIYWAKPLPEDVLSKILQGSMCFGVYRRLSPSESGEKRTEQVGLARMITDGSTFAYLSDTYVLPECQGYGLGKWLFRCVAEVFSTENMPYLRRIMLLTHEKKTQDFYTKALGVKVVGQEERPDTGKDLVFMCARPGVDS